MATNEKKNSERKNSLSSYSDYKGKGETPVPNDTQNRKKTYRITQVMKKNEVKNRQQFRKNIAGYGKNVGENTSAKNSAKENVKTNAESVRNYVKENDSVHIYDSEHRTDKADPTTSSALSPEMKQRMQRAAFMAELNKENIKVNSAMTISNDTDDEIAETKSAEHINDDLRENNVSTEAEKAPEEHKYFTRDTAQPSAEVKKNITPEMAERMKRAAFIAQKNAEKIRLNRVTAVPEDEQEPTEKAPVSDTPLEDDPVDHVDESKEEKHEGIPEAVAESGTFGTNESYIRDYKAKKAYHDFIEKRHRNGGYANEKAFDDKAEKKADENTASLVGKFISDESAEIIGEVSTVSGTVRSSSSVGNAVMDLSTTLATIEAKKLLKNLANTDIRKQERAADRAEHNGNRFGIEKYDEVTKHESAHQSEERKQKSESDEPDRETKGRIKVGNSHKMQEEKKAYSKKQRAKEIKQKRQEIYFKDNPTAMKDLVEGHQGRTDFVKHLVKRKAVSLIMGAGGAAVVTLILIVIVVFILILAFCGWLTPFDYSLAGEDADSDPHQAQTQAEIIDGYTLMIKNYMDVTQAYYYLNYGDWYGGTYDYPAPDLNFADFYADYCQTIIAQIQSQYMSMLQNQTNPQIINAIYQAMQTAINSALADAMPRALAEYDALMAELDDTMTADEHRQHYEVIRSEIPNTHADSAEFTGKPIVGTNNFGNVEINSDLSAEQLLAYIALYKSMQTINPDDSDPDAEVVLNITPDDIMKFFEETEYISITTEITHNNTCDNQNCKRRMTGDSSNPQWEYYCDHDHDKLSGEIGACLTEDELRAKIMEITESEDNGIDEDAFKKLIDEYIKLIKKELDIDEGDFRKFGAADNEKAKEFYDMLVADGEIPNNSWTVNTPIGEDTDD